MYVNTLLCLCHLLNQIFSLQIEDEATVEGWRQAAKIPPVQEAAAYPYRSAEEISALTSSVKIDIRSCHTGMAEYEMGKP